MSFGEFTGVFPSFSWSDPFGRVKSDASAAKIPVEIKETSAKEVSAADNRWRNAYEIQAGYVSSLQELTRLQSETITRLAKENVTLTQDNYSMRQENDRLKQELSTRRVHLPKRDRKQVIQRDSVCYLCGGRLDKSLKFPHPYSVSVDHVTPVSKGGTNDIGNLKAVHLCCNKQKNALPAQYATCVLKAKRIARRCEVATEVI